ncbi:MAG: HD domain-containing protein [Bdellovibrionales bacterium]|nr:HD domain-containing protein [Bdellovibrionales bacterium]
MIPSKDIAEYFPAEFSKLRVDSEIPFHLYLYFPQNRHLILWKNLGETLSAEFLERYSGRSLNRIWIHKSEKAAYLSYMGLSESEAPLAPAPEAPKAAVEAPSRPESPAPPPAATAAPAPADTGPLPVEAPPPRTEEGALIAATMNAPEVPPEAKKAVVAQIAQGVLEELGEADSARDQVKRNEKAREIIQDVLEGTSASATSLVQEIWKMADIDPDLEHSVNVATYAVVFAMAFGRIDQELVADLAMAGLLHDIGLCQVDGRASRRPWVEMDDASHLQYRGHVPAGLALLARHAPDVPERVRAIIGQTHEKFDGSGYPEGLRGFKLDDVAQLVAMSEFVDSISSGQWDGQRRTLKDALQIIEGFERKRSFPEFFNPEVFAEVMRWTKSATDPNALSEAAQAVGQQAKQVVDSKAA